jgi:diguanylate cyclase (GGDEF)-like protein/PAS domain S-box-containing protein
MAGIVGVKHPVGILRAPMRLGRFTWQHGAALVAFLIVAIAGIFAESQDRLVHQQQERADVSRSAGIIRARLEGDINGNIQLVRGLVSVIALEPDMSQDRFAAIAAGLMRGQTDLRSIAAAPDLIVSLVHPIEGNERVLGLDYRQNADQRDAAMRVMERGDLVMAGPLTLVQGGIGLIGRYPVFVASDEGERFWGLVSAVVDVEKLYEESGLLAEDLPITIAIRGRDGLGAIGAQFYGPASVFDDNPVLMEVQLPTGVWQIAAVPKEGWQPVPDDIWLLRLAFLAAAFLVATPILVAGRLVDERQRHVEELGEREQRLERLSQRLELALDTSKIGVWELDITTGQSFWDERMRELYGIPPESEIEPTSLWESRLHPDDREAARADFAAALYLGRSYASDYRVVRPDGTVRSITAIGRTLLDRDGHVKIVGVNRDVTGDIEVNDNLVRAKTLAEARAADLELARQQMEFNALHDPLTGLPNRRFLDRVLAEGGPNPREPVSRLSLMHIDLDRFKAINDTMGHAAGDAMLKHTAQTLRRSIQMGDFVARIGGDEFVIVMQRSLDEEALACLAQRLIDDMRLPVRFEGQDCRCGVSIGIAMGHDEMSDIRQLLVNADLALYRAKRSGRGRHAFFQLSLQTEIVQAKHTADELVQALERDEFVAWYQPQFCAKDFTLCGVEALVRWAHPTRGTLAPDAFLTIAEDMNMVAAIDQSVLRQALLQNVRWQAHGHRVAKMSVNVSASRLRDESLITTLEKLNIKPGTVSFELLESTFFDDGDQQMMQTIGAIEKLGIDIEIDDFGSGHASFVSLLKLRPRRLKIDRQLVLPIVASPAQQDLVGAIINIGRSMNIDVVAEGVETMEHARLLQAMGCDILQGYAFARPMAPDQFLAFLSNTDTSPLRTQRA